MEVFGGVLGGVLIFWWIGIKWNLVWFVRDNNMKLRVKWVIVRGKEFMISYDYF